MRPARYLSNIQLSNSRENREKLNIILAEISVSEIRFRGAYLTYRAIDGIIK